MIEQIRELWVMQKELDAEIFKKHNITEYPWDNVRIALMVELGELMNEFPSKFKHWKVSPVDDRETGLIEFVDCLHFVLSMCSEEDMKWIEKYPDNFNMDTTLLDDSIYLTLFRINAVDSARLSLFYLLQLGNTLGFTWGEVYQAYLRKNKINYTRLERGY